MSAIDDPDRMRKCWRCNGRGELWFAPDDAERCERCGGVGLLATRGAARAHRRRLVGDARRVRERARRNVLRHLGRLFIVQTDLRYTEASGSLPLGARVFLYPKNAAGEECRENWMDTADAWPHEGLLGGSWRCDGSAVYGGREHLRHDRREHRLEVDAVFESRDLDPDEMPF